MFLYIPQRYGIHLCPIVKKGHAAFPIYPHFGYILHAIPSLKRIRIQEGSLRGWCYAS